MSRLLLILFFLILSNCASVQSPKGGPIDEIPPTLMGVQPKELTNINPEEKITIRFSEFMKESSIKGSLKILPMNAADIRYEFKGDRIDLWLPKNLNANKTYLLMFDSNLMDEHGIAIKEDIVIPFTMNSEYDTAKIEGFIYGDIKKASVLLWLGLVSKDKMLNTPPDFIANMNEKNQFKFNYLPESSFSILAVEQYGSNIDYSKGRFSFYHEDSISTVNNELKNLEFYVRKKPNFEIDNPDSAIIKDNLDILDLKKDSNQASQRVAKVLGNISGQYLHPIKISIENKVNKYTQTVNLDGSFAINDMLGGKYQMLIFEDRNNNNKLDVGSFVQGDESEKFSVYPDSLVCRENWELELPLWKYKNEDIQ